MSLNRLVSIKFQYLQQIRDVNAKHGLGRTTNLHYTAIFRSNPTLRGYRKRMLEIWQEYTSFQSTSQRLVDQVGTIIKKGLFSDLEILETNNEQDTNTVSDTLGFNKQEQSNRNEPPTPENRNTAHPLKHSANSNTRTKNKFRKFKENY